MLAVAASEVAIFFISRYPLEDYAYVYSYSRFVSRLDFLLSSVDLSRFCIRWGSSIPFRTCDDEHSVCISIRERPTIPSRSASRTIRKLIWLCRWACRDTLIFKVNSPCTSLFVRFLWFYKMLIGIQWKDARCMDHCINILFESTRSYRL